uniref:histidine kinase n=1 Tax=Phenylobacterium glaciei TaxID=2803784 RepID=A0A974P454_9CAUL|nr:PAS domain S-box protein [Phenylobacterium glaciei]
MATGPWPRWWGAASRLTGAQFATFVTPGSSADFARLLKNGGKAELVLTRADRAETFVAQLSLTRTDPGDGGFLCGVLTDLTSTYSQAREIAEAKSALAVEAAHRESDERYRLILEGASDYAIMATDLDERVTIWNAGARQILGWDATELIGRRFPAIWTPDDRAAGADDHERAHCLASGRSEVERWHLRKDGEPFWAHTLMMPLRKDDGRLIGFLKILRDRTEQRVADEKQSLLVNELNHRVKNTLATVQSIAAQTMRSAPSAEQGRAALEERLLALSKAHDVLTRESWEGAELSEIVAVAVSPYLGADPARIVTGGPGIRLAPGMALAIAMALQELATNAAKYGALSVPEGRLSIHWTLDADLIALRWEETGGPLVVPPLRRSFGSRLIERSLSAELGRLRSPSRRRGHLPDHRQAGDGRQGPKRDLGLVSQGICSGGSRLTLSAGLGGVEGFGLHGTRAADGLHRRCAGDHHHHHGAGAAATAGARFEDLAELLPVFLSYVLSFVYIGIYWNNHHHFFQLVRQVDGAILWANLHLLFWLSMVPFTTAWMGRTTSPRRPPRSMAARC